MRPVGIDHVVLRVRDQAACERFYTEVLGCTVERRQDGIGLVQLRAGDALIDLVSVDGTLGQAGGAAPGAEGHNMDHLCLRIADFDAARIGQELLAHGITPSPPGSRYGAGGEGISVYLADIEGNRLELRG